MKKRLLSMILILALASGLLPGTAAAAGAKPTGGMRGITVTEEGNALPNGNGIIGPTECVTGASYRWEYRDSTARWYELCMAVLDGTYANPNTADVMYAPARSRGTAMDYTFYIPGTYVLFVSVYDSEFSQYLAASSQVHITVEDGGANDLTRKVKTVAAANKGANAYETALNLHDWVLDHCVYDTTYTYYSAESLMLHGTGVCNSYARAYKLLLDECGIACRRVAGYAYGEPSAGHAWNAAKIGGKWYLFDLTWDDGSDNEYGRHFYFAVSDELMDLEHTPQNYSDGEDWPVCTALEDNWFVRQDKWKDLAPALYQEYMEKLAEGMHRFTLAAPNWGGQYQRVMTGTVSAFALGHTAWPYGTEGKTTTGTFTYHEETSTITGKHNGSGTLEIPAGMKQIGAGSFENAAANNVVIGAACRYIGPRAFSGMEIWELRVDAKSMTIDPAAFEGVENVYVIAAPDSTIAAYAAEHGWTVGDGKD
jgi:hypothetical protein